MIKCPVCGYPEDRLYQVGTIKLCGWCLSLLEERGYARIGKVSGVNMVLLSDGSLISEKEFDKDSPKVKPDTPKSRERDERNEGIKEMYMADIKDKDIAEFFGISIKTVDKVVNNR